MKQIQWLMLVIIITLSLGACGPSAASYNNDGNADFESGEFDAALEDYTAARLEDPNLAEPYYNGGNTYYRKGDLERAQLQLDQSVRRAEEEISQYTHFNLGNTFFQQENWAEAIEAYQQALRLNPDDIDAKNNLEMALKQQEQQRQQQQQQQQGGSSGQNDQQEQEQGGGQQGQQPQQGQQGQDQNDGQGQGQNEQENEGGSGGQEQQESQQPNSGSGRTELTPEEAEQLLDALGQDNQTLQERLGQRHNAQGAPPVQDW
jgi:Ca-activated chloride channel family protein